MAEPTPPRRVWAILAAQVAAALAVTACSLAPPYQTPPLGAPTPSAYKETGIWTPADPADSAPRGDWWTAYGDPTLNDLEARLRASNPDLVASLARYDQARALAAQAQSRLAPELDLQGYATRTKQSDAAPLRGTSPAYYDNVEIGGSIAYELDFWGHIRNQVKASKANAQASAGDLASARLSLQAQIADDYLALRGFDAEAKVLADTVVTYEHALDLTQHLFNGGVVSGIDVGQARTQLETARAAQFEVAAQRALDEHAIAALAGQPASSFSIPVSTTLPVQPRIPVATPSLLLQRRPDIAAAERRAYAANAMIGVARAAYFPTITLDATGGFQDAGEINLLSLPNAAWTVGPALAMPLFDAGRRRAVVAQSKAEFEEASANYRSTVLAAFQQVEDNLALCNKLADESAAQDQAVTAAKQAEALSLVRYRDGAITYLDVVVNQTTALQAERAALSLDTRRLQASVDLIRALGGDWAGAKSS